jgi:L-alanine-DL-glutamate epimerase-like enolase superfamily enzyme
MQRRTFLTLAGAFGARAQTGRPRTAPEYEKPLFDFHAACPRPVKVVSIELLSNGSQYFVRSTAATGETGIARTKQVVDYIPILLRRAIPFFLGKDARDLETLIDGVYIENYKMAGQPFWCPVAFVELSLLDLMGKIARKPIGELLGGLKRSEIPVYLSGSDRVLKAEEEVEVYVRGVAETRAKAVKFKIGGRMSHNRDVYPGRTERLLELGRKKLGDRMILYADANGSYDSKVGIEIGRMMQDLDYRVFEEPCPWEEVGETKKVADALDIPISGGEQDSSLWKFQWMLETGVIQIVQPDLNYNGGMIRSARVGRMARLLGRPIVPHNTQTDSASANILHFASAMPNMGPYIEFPWRAPQKPVSWYTPDFRIVDGRIKVPAGPGLGVEYDPDYLRKLVRVES